MSDIKKAIDTIIDRRNSYLTAEAYYEGINSEVFPNNRWYKLLGGSPSDFRFNFARTVVDSVLNRLEIANIVANTTEANKQINEIWQMNDLQIDADEIHRRALVYGDCYAIVWTDIEGNVTVDYNSPLTTVMIYDDERPRVKRFAAKLWQSEDPLDHTKKTSHLNMYYPDRIEKYTMPGEVVNVVSANGFLLNEIIENPWGEVPVFHFRTSKQYGRPEHVDAYGPQDAINKLIVTHMTTVDYQGAPQRYALSGAGNSSEFEDFDEEGTETENLGRLKNGPGELWYLKGIDKVGEFSPADHKVFTEPVKDFVRAMASITCTPLHYFEKTGSIPSGESLRTAEAPLIAKVKDRQITFGSTWADMFRFILRIDNPAEPNVLVKWVDIESMDSLDAWEVAVKKRVVGVSLEQVLIEMGYDLESARAIAAVEQSLTSLSQNVNTNNVLMEATGGNVGNE
ncbi:MAG: phage portal protein [Nitrosopumilaceae archaeon]|nr:phage portal protein [Nitrososphaeria archaeon]NDB52114.1 phage portal protein [Nitrosopumilaceae archaeon]NDF27614.1 phage portal protein [Nitrosopumilaceae archaeon]NDF35593.1 phage portal protein [Nitrosopumilaceae archaeon]NDF48293.1 phage portal protein [Nitrosopumilaceae archaeon]